MVSRKKTARKPARGSRKPARPSPELMEELKQFVRTQGADYLKDPNITSVGIGYKQKEGERTRELAIQFTVGVKAVPELLSSLGTREIPPSFNVNGVDVPTDVVQREFKPDARVVPEPAPDPRKTRINPIVPGVSVAHKTVTAGTIGCIVFDQLTGTPYILSNWHVLHGPGGEIGDDIVQPGPHDDNRVNLNRVGKLVRSHLGAAGDCAIATIENRSFSQEIFELGVKVEQIGEPELDDKVIKSGRTTSVTHGIVTRVHTIASINYGGSVGVQDIGGFEIGADEENLPDNGEISMGGDSGSVWLFKASNGKPSKIMAGLHFAGEGAGDPNEHAIACYPRSVFEKLEISLTQPEPAPQGVSGRGYNPNFLGTQVNLPRLSASNRQDAFKLNGSEVIDYTHFSLAQSKTRRFAFWVAWNIDGGSLKSLSRKGIDFVFDERIPEEFQVGDDLYAGNRLDRGHIARRADLLWGSLAEARRANIDSFFFTNITPQMDNFNQSSQGGIWGRLEDALFDEVDVEDLRISVFGGPIFHDDDRVFRGVRIPREFYKVLAFVEDGTLKARAFLLTQSLDQLELLDLKQFKVFQASLGEIEQRGGFTFPNNLKAADGFAELLEGAPEAAAERAPLGSLDDIAW
jgi:endonuclease G